MDHFEQLSAQLRTATRPDAIFGLCDGTELQRRYRTYARIVHPDHNSSRVHAATELFVRLQQLYQQALEQCVPLVIETSRARYTTHGLARRGLLTDLYLANSATRPVLLRIARGSQSSAYMRAEVRALETLDRALADQAVRAHFPVLIEHAAVRDATGTPRPLHVLHKAPGFVSLADVLRAYPGGIDAADAAWMFNRLLAMLGVAHAQGIVHAAVVPEHVLICPHDHNGMLVDWCWSVPVGAPLARPHPSRRAASPPEALAGQPATPATDLYMAARCMLRVLGGTLNSDSLPKHVPKPLRAVLAGCLIPAPARRTHDAWQLLDDLRDIFAALYGPPRFRPFALPVRY